MTRSYLVIFALLAMFALAFAQTNSSSSTGGMIVDSSSSSSGSSLESSSSSSEVLDSSSTIIVNVSSSSGAGMVNSSSSTPIVVSSSSGSAVDNTSSSSYYVDSSSSSNNPYPYVPSDWEDISVSDNNTVFFITWGAKTTDNLMYGVGGADGFIINNQSGAALRLVSGYNYTLSIDDLAAPQGLYISYDAMGGSAAGSNISSPITVAGNYSIVVDFANNDDTTIVYYASSTTDYAGGAIIVGTSSAAALQTSFVVLAASAFAALLFPKW